MKKNLLKTSAFFVLVALMASCNSDEATINTTAIVPQIEASADTPSTARGTFWSAAIGEINPDGSATITADTVTITADLEEILDSEGNTTTLTAVKIIKKVNVNDASNATYALVGTNSTGISIGVFLLANNGYVYLDDGYGNTGGNEIYSTTCRGCADGCNLMYITVGGKKVFYCDENVCGNFCSKNETTSVFTHGG
jgi:hypothetical protein